MKTSRTITLFTPPSPSRTGPSSFMVSVVLHGVVLGLMFFALSHAPRISDRHLDQRYTVRILKLHGTEPQIHWSPGSGIALLAQSAATRATQSGGQPAAPALQQLAQRSPAPMTLVQPDVPPNTLISQTTSIPLVVMWAPENNPVTKIVPPPPQTVAATNVRPSLSRPNHESNLADLEISSSAFVTDTLSLPPSTTSPVTVAGPELAEIPKTASTSFEQSTPTTIVSISDLLLPEGIITLPLANQIAPGSISKSIMPGRPDSTSEAGKGATIGQQKGSGAGSNPDGKENLEVAANGSAGRSSTTAESNFGSDTGSVLGNGSTVDRIALPKDGKFGVVVVGSSLTEEYPETLGAWADRLAYTVFLHVGLAKNWILQYSLPRTVEAAGRTTRPDAPWPYLILRPHLVPGDSDADAILVHGFINTGGRFEQLAVVFPPQFEQTKFVLGALQQWQFRPASQNGRLTAVEVLLIIPEESE